MLKIKNNLKKFKNKLTEYSNDLKSVSILGSLELSQLISNAEWFRSLNDYTSEVSKTMDHNFVKSLYDSSAEKMAPIYHRILDGGHDLFSSIDIAQKIGKENNWTNIQTFQEWAKSYLSDLSSPAGMPVFGKMSESVYHFLQSIGFDESTARDFITINGQEALEALLSGGIMSLSLYYSWKNEDKELFSKTIASLLITSTLTLNPASFILALVGFGVGYHKIVHSEAMARGAIITASSFLLSTIIPGPVFLGTIPGIILAIYLSKKMGKEFNPIQVTKSIYNYISSKDYQEIILNFYQEKIIPKRKDVA